MTSVEYRYMTRNMMIPDPGPAAAGWTPASLPNLVGWYDASNAGSITASSGAVSQWNDLSGNGFHLTQATAGNQPITGSLTQNSLNVIKFDGIDDYMENLSSTSLDATAVSLYAVFFFTTVDFTSTLVRLGNANVVWGLRFNVNRVDIQADYGANITGSGTQNGAAHQASLIGGTSGAATIYIDGASKGTGSGAAGSEGHVRVGQTSAFYGVSSTLWLAETFWANINNVGSDRNSAESYLKAKWGTP